MSEKEKKHKLSRKLKVYLILFALLIVLAGLFTFYRRDLKNKLRLKIESIRAAGYSLTMDELNKKYSIPAGTENAADLIIEAMFDYYKEPNNVEIQKLLIGSTPDIPVYIKPYSEKIVTLMSQFLKENEKALEMLHKASGLQYNSYPENFEEIGGFLNVTNSIKLLFLQSVYFSETGDSDSALKALISSFNIISLFANEPMFSYHFTRMFYYSQMVLTLKRVLNKTNFTDEQLVKLEEAVTEVINLSDLYRFYEEQMCRIFDLFRHDDNITEDIVPGDVALPIAQFYKFFYQHLGIVDTDRILYLEYMCRYIEAAKLPIKERYDTFQKIEEDVKNLSGFYLLSNVLLPVLNRYIDIDKKVIPNLHAAKTAIAVKRYCLAKGSLPDTLKDLIPAYLDMIPVTPDGKELKYKKIEAGCIIYSEENRKNNTNKTLPQSDLINHGIENLGVWFMIENKKGVLQ